MSGETFGSRLQTDLRLSSVQMIEPAAVLIQITACEFVIELLGEFGALPVSRLLFMSAVADLAN